MNMKILVVDKSNGNTEEFKMDNVRFIKVEDNMFKIFYVGETAEFNVDHYHIIISWA